MNIAFFGSSLVSSHWNGAATYYRGLLKALAGHGHEITFYEPDAYDRQQNRDIEDPDWARVVVYPATPGAFAEPLDRAARKADLLIKASGVGVFDRELEEAVPHAVRSGATAAFWDVDAPATLARIAADGDDHMRRVLPSYDVVFTYGGGPPVVEAYLALGARACIPVYNAVDPELHHPAPSRPEYGCDLSLLANRLPDREARIGTFFLEPARRLAGKRFLLGGAGWQQEHLPANVKALGHVGTAHHNAFFCSGLATLNVTRDSMAANGFSPATRVFEAAGAGACLITDAWEGIAMFLEPGREVIVASNADDVIEAIAALTPDRARLIGQAARRRVLADHTYAHRAATVSALLAEPSLRGTV